MHILFASTDFVDNNGPTTGLPKYLFRTSKALIEWGHEVTIVTCANRTVEYEFFGINVHRVRRPEIIHYEEPVKNGIAECLRDGYIISEEIERVYNKKKIDIIQYTSLCGVAYYHNINVPAVMRLSSYAIMVQWIGQEEYMSARAEIERAAAYKCDAIFAPSYVVANRFGKDVQRSIDVIETPFVLETEENDKTIYLSHFEGRKYILFYGTLVVYKGLDIISESIYEILSEHPDIYIGIIGDGEKRYLYDIKSNAREYGNRVIYHPAIGFSQLIPIIQNAELTVLPSLMENLSNACVETMALGQIVVGTNGASFEQLIVDGESGFLCEPGNRKSFVEKINESLNLSEEKKAMIKSNAILRIQKLNPHLVTRNLLEYYEKVISEWKVNG